MKTKVYLDNCCYGRPYDDQTQTRIHSEAQAKMKIQQMVEAGTLKLVASSFLLDENDKKSDSIAKNNILKYIDSNMGEFVEGQNNEDLWSLAKSIEDDGIKSMDAAHLASAIITECSYFITTDDRILKYNTNIIKIIDPVRFITIVG